MFGNKLQISSSTSYREIPEKGYCSEYILLRKQNKLFDESMRSLHVMDDCEIGASVMKESQRNQISAMI